MLAGTVDSDQDLTQENIMSDSNDSNPDSEAAKVAAAEKAVEEAAGEGNEVVIIEPPPTNFNSDRMLKTGKAMFLHVLSSRPTVTGSGLLLLLRSAMLR